MYTYLKGRNTGVYFFVATLLFRASTSCSKSWMVKIYSIQCKISGETLFSGQAEVAQNSWMKSIFNAVKFSGQLCFSGRARVAQNSWMIKNTYSTQWKFSGQLCFWGQARVDQNSWMIKNSYLIQWKFSGQPLCFRARASCSKILNVKSIFNTARNCRATLFSGQAQVAQKSWMIKNTYSIQWKISRQLYFSGQVQVAQNSWMWKVYSIQWKIAGQLCFFRASASCSKIVYGENIFDKVYIHLGVIRVIWASVVCNLDKSRDCL